MYWQQDNENTHDIVISDDIVDMLFRLKGTTLPIDHAHSLSNEICNVLPWLATEAKAGVHLIHVAESGNGWIKPQDTSTQCLHLSKRTKLALRLPKERLQLASTTLTGKIFDISGHRLEIGTSSIRTLSKSTTLFSRHVVAEQQSEIAFMENQHQALAQLQITVKKMLCGKQSTFYHPQAPIFTRSLLVADLSVTESVKLQQAGLGGGRKMGFGLFIPHKSIAAVKDIGTQQRKF